jgi:pilus assembly protein TadC
MFFAPDLVVRSQAQEARARFRRAVGSYLDLVALERGADGGPAEALTRAAEVAHGREFRRIGDALVAARLRGATPWQALSELAAEVGVEELADLADVIALAGDDGAAVADTLTAKATALRTRQLAESAAAANTASEKLTLPGVVLAFAFLVLVCYPALARVLGHT